MAGEPPLVLPANASINPSSSIDYPTIMEAIMDCVRRPEKSQLWEKSRVSGRYAALVACEVVLGSADSRK